MTGSKVKPTDVLVRPTHVVLPKVQADFVRTASGLIRRTLLSCNRFCQARQILFSAGLPTIYMQPSNMWHSQVGLLVATPITVCEALA